MSNIKPTKEALFLNKALKIENIETELEHYDKHKHIDIYVPKSKIYIEIDGIQHYTNAKQISQILKEIIIQTRKVLRHYAYLHQLYLTK